MLLHARSFCPAQLLKQAVCECVVYAGNFFFAGARTFFNSLEAAIFLFSRVARIPEGSSVMPVISTEERITLGAVLSNGLVIKGQNQISHPSVAGPFQLALHLLYQDQYNLTCQCMIILSKRSAKNALAFWFKIAAKYCQIILSTATLSNPSPLFGLLPCQAALFHKVFLQRSYCAAEHSSLPAE